MNPERPEAARWFYGADTANTRCAVLRNVSVGRGSLLEMSRHTTFRFCLDPNDERQHLLTRHAGAARFAFNQCLRIVKDALSARLTNPSVDVPWTGFDLINAFNSWKKTPDAGRVFVVGEHDLPCVMATGLPWRTEVCQQVFEEAAVDCGRALVAWSDSRKARRKGRRVGFPRFKKKGACRQAFRLRNKQIKGRRPAIRVGDDDRPRSITLPGIGSVRVHDDTRRLRRMLRNGRARILFATISHRAGRWWLSLNVEAADLHDACRHSDQQCGDESGWVGVDRGLTALVVAARADGTEVLRIANLPRPLFSGSQRERRLMRSLFRKKEGSRNRRDAANRVARHHYRVANIRRHLLHQVSNELVKTHDKLVIEDLGIAGMMANRRLARSICDASWGELARQLRYKADWRGGQFAIADRWFPSSKRCSVCGDVKADIALGDRVFTCACGHSSDRDRNAAANLAQWPQSKEFRSTPRTWKQRAGLPMPADATVLTSTSVPERPLRKKRERKFMPLGVNR